MSSLPLSRRATQPNHRAPAPLPPLHLLLFTFDRRAHRPVLSLEFCSTPFVSTLDLVKTTLLTLYALSTTQPKSRVDRAFPSGHPPYTHFANTVLPCFASISAIRTRVRLSRSRDSIPIRLKALSGCSQSPSDHTRSGTGPIEANCNSLDGFLLLLESLKIMNWDRTYHCTLVPRALEGFWQAWNRQ